MTPEKVRVAFPARCAVAVVCGDQLVSQVYPAAVPVEAFIDDAVELISADLQRRGACGLDAESGYELNRINGARLDMTKSLGDLGIEDGTTLVLSPTRPGESYEAIYESLSTGLARTGKRLFEPVTAQVAVSVSLAIVAMTALTIVGLTTYTRILIDSAAPSFVAGALGVILLCAAFSVLRKRPHRMDLFRGFAWPAIPLTAAALGLAAPGGLASPHAFTALVAVGALTCVVVAMSRRNVLLGAVVTTICAIGCLGVGVQMWSAVLAPTMGIGLLLLLLVVVTIAPTISLRAARIRPPHFGSITGRDLFRRNDGLPVDTVSPVVDDADIDSASDQEGSNPDSTPRGSDVAAAATRANAVLSGICIGVSMVFPAAVWLSLGPGQGQRNAAAVLVALFVVIFVSRARAFADRCQAIALVVGASAGVCAAVTRYVADGAAVSTANLIWASAVVGCFAAAGLVAALVVPETRFTPLIRMLAEWAELLAIVGAFPLAAWITGLFTWVRMR